MATWSIQYAKIQNKWFENMSLKMYGSLTIISSAVWRRGDTCEEKKLNSQFQRIFLRKERGNNNRILINVTTIVFK